MMPIHVLHISCKLIEYKQPIITKRPCLGSVTTSSCSSSMETLPQEEEEQEQEEEEESS
jgi:hypothetical protein